MALQHYRQHTFVHRIQPLTLGNGFRSSLGQLADRHYTSDIVLSNDGWLTATTPPTLCPATAQPCNTANKQAVEAQLRIRHGQQLVQQHKGWRRA
ncbi:hypothetical protein CHLRE_17g743397v5 [Chlamydomonas reinhardtii]|uniref:Uncharacterized protein n=1 Tax=Chlamydomonas reinhardtii TaxID=3055 RepID=A0A2K3CRY3_CHLRE|nr:uncharacterized protein CHLRE_17g743397v5 [Chlamydomonas reinhardtii]XP_042915153.1 uncharacterized protein CHLRE_17g743397v5 [Chlamydomonas reinhardtii]PNW71027.1 hypothetical protein CHLRE_17g743397v5 [Chlamydomonas reinhardtii]PNW71028.1 hypothetical protein CHLRE_17g743397v5 [Chlamydomonas reinhardtii]